MEGSDSSPTPHPHPVTGRLRVELSTYTSDRGWRCHTQHHVGSKHQTAKEGAFFLRKGLLSVEDGSRLSSRVNKAAKGCCGGALLVCHQHPKQWQRRWSCELLIQYQLSSPLMWLDLFLLQNQQSVDEFSSKKPLHFGGSRIKLAED